jgi:hypothetical protein
LLDELRVRDLDFLRPRDDDDDDDGDDDPFEDCRDEGTAVEVVLLVASWADNDDGLCDVLEDFIDELRKSDIDNAFDNG